MKRLWDELYGLVRGARKLTQDTLHHKKTTTYKPQVMLLSLHYLVRKICKAKLLQSPLLNLVGGRDLKARQFFKKESGQQTI